MKEREKEKLLQSYVYTEKYGDFFVSTVYRVSSVMQNPAPWFYETIAWKLDKDGLTRLESVADNSGAGIWERAIDQHVEVVRQLNETGVFKNNEE